MLESIDSRLPHRMQRILTSFALLLALGMSADRATALGFGKVTSATALGQPLSFAIALRLDPNETLEARCIKAEVSLGDRVLVDAQVRARLETAATTGERRVRITTTIPVDEPVVSIQLHVGCPASLSRSFMVFADPPGRGALAPGGEPAEETWVPDRASTAVGDVLSAVPVTPSGASAAVPSSRARPPRAPGSPTRAEVASAAREAAPAAAASPRSRSRTAVKAKTGPVLRLDPVEADALILPSLQMATSLSQAPDTAASGATPRFVDPEQEQRLRELERLKAMEAALLKLRSDSEATHKALGDMQLRVRAAEASRYANPLVYLLVALCAVLTAGLAGMFWLRRRDRRSAAWWTPPVEASPPAMVAEDVWTPPPVSPTPETVSLRDTLMATPMPAPPPPAVPSRSGELDAAVLEPRRPMSAEELIDLEQQAEFFVVLGQDDAAIDLLMGHVRSTGGVSPLPYLKLLEIYRRRGERDPYDRIRERFNRRFNAYAPEWDVDPELGLSLEGYPEVMSRLQKAWATPSQAMDLLDASLFRRDAGPTFDVPAYRELLFLYGMSRDLAERDTSPEGVDLLLPLNDEPASTLTTVEASAPPAEPEHFSIDLDVSTDQPPHLTLEDPDFKRNVR
jgi:pilus assembly protein FimV